MRIHGWNSNARSRYTGGVVVSRKFAWFVLADLGIDRDCPVFLISSQTIHLAALFFEP